MEGMIYLADGTVYRGMGFGAADTRAGELVFNTSMTGYQGILTDPSYNGQIINMTYPLIGNYGVSRVDNQSDRIYAFGLVTRDISFRPSNRMSVLSINEWLSEQGVPGVYNVDTRSITKKIRREGAVGCVISTEGITRDDAECLLKTTVLRGDYMKETGTSVIRRIPGVSPIPGARPPHGTADPPGAHPPHGTADPPGARPPHGTTDPPGARPPHGTADPPALPGAGYKVAILDFGIKRSIIDCLTGRGCDVVLFPYGSTADEILAEKPDGLFLSNGPGDPSEADLGVETTRRLMDKLPVFGICMGHQILGLAAGGRTWKLKFGHRGGNHGVLDLEANKASITAQNHSFVVDGESVKAGGMVITHVNLNDGTIEGMRHRDLPVFSVQFHPEGSPGPNDSEHLFDRFVDLMKEWKEGGNHA
jgi:carbamoyl-phosphate synthase small subunit